MSASRNCNAMGSRLEPTDPFGVHLQRQVGRGNIDQLAPLVPNGQSDRIERRRKRTVAGERHSTPRARAVLERG